MQREEWEREEEEQMKRPVGPIHYENIKDQGEETQKTHVVCVEHVSELDLNLHRCLM